MAQHGVGDAQIAFGVLEVDRVDLVRHGGRADLAGHGTLLEVTQRDVAPDVTIEVDQDGVEAADGIEQLGDVVVRLDLGSVRVEGQPEALDEGFGVGRPVDGRIGGQVGVVVAHGTVDLAEHLDAFDLRQLTTQTRSDVGHFLAEGGRAGRLAMGARQHRLFGVLVGQRDDRFGHFTHLRQQHVVQAATQHQGMRQVVDVFTGAGEVDELGDGVEFGVAFDLFLQEVLDRLHVVVGGAFDVLDALGILDTEFTDDAIQHGVGIRGEGRHFSDLGVGGQALQPAHLDDDAGTDQAEFTEVLAQGLGLGAIAAIDGRQGGEGGQLHDENLPMVAGHDALPVQVSRSPVDGLQRC